MDVHAVDAEVTGYEDLIPGLQLPDPNYRHELAAAIRGEADVIVTMNPRDFPANAVGAFGIDAQHPDEFVLRLFGVVQVAVLVAGSRWQNLKHLEMLKRQGLERLDPVRAEEFGLAEDGLDGFFLEVGRVAVAV